MKGINLSNKIVTSIIAVWSVVFFLLSIFKINNFQVLNIVGFLYLVLVPGFLLSRFARLHTLDFWMKMVVSVAFSLLSLMVLGLLNSAILPFLGIVNPLSNTFLVLSVALMVDLFLLANIYFKNSLSIKFDNVLVGYSARDYVFVLTPLIFIVMTLIGAVRLNNGGDGGVTLFMLIFMGIYCCFLIYNSNRLGKNVIETSLFLLSISLLMMTSLRGWYVTGHDIQREFKVFQLTKDNQIWKISFYRDAYNACMSITVLPTIFSKMLDIFDPYVYKILFQIIFSVVPVVVYRFARQNTTILISLLATYYFMFFPTFFTDMPFLNRQEVAFLFLTLMFYILFDHKIELKKRRIIFSILGIGMILSHYSTTYTVIALLIFVLISRPIFIWASKFRFSKKILYSSSVKGADETNLNSKKLITVWMVAILMVCGFFWSGIITDTAGNSLYRVINKTIQAITSSALEDGKSTAVLSYNIFSWGKSSPGEIFDEYKSKVVDVARNGDSPDTYYSADKYAKYNIKLIDEENLPLTDLGNLLRSFGVDVPYFNFMVRAMSAKVLQLLIVIGIFAMFFTKKYFINDVDDEYLLLCFASLVFLFLQIVLPVLSSEYGVMRAFQQSLLFLGVLIVIGSQFILTKFSNKTQRLFASFFVMFFFFSITGVMTQLLGGYGPQLHLNNAGSYFEKYYLHESEVLGIDWLAKEVSSNNKVTKKESVVQTDRFALNNGSDNIHARVLRDIYPGIVQKESYIFFDQTNILKQKSSNTYNDSNFSYSYPVNFLNENKSLIYNNGGVNIYK